MLLKIVQVDEETLAILKEEENQNDRSSFEEASSSIRMKIMICSTMMRMFRTLREERELIMKLKGFCPGNKIPKGLLLQGPEALKSAYERFTKVKTMDSINELRPNLANKN
jgi:serine/threonine-protein phosphatase 2B catalytic subunit